MHSFRAQPDVSQWFSTGWRRLWHSVSFLYNKLRRWRELCISRIYRSSSFGSRTRKREKNNLLAECISMMASTGEHELHRLMRYCPINLGALQTSRVIWFWKFITKYNYTMTFFFFFFQNAKLFGAILVWEKQRHFYRDVAASEK